MDAKRTLQATFWMMLALNTVGSMDLPDKGERKLPAPRAYVAPFVLWWILSLIAEVGEAQARLAARLSILVLLTAAVIGPFGRTAVSFLEGVSKRFAVEPVAVPGPAGPAPGARPRPATTGGGTA